jgi:hypothetical protein
MKQFYNGRHYGFLIFCLFMSTGCASPTPQPQTPQPQTRGEILALDLIKLFDFAIASAEVGQQMIKSMGAGSSSFSTYTFQNKRVSKEEFVHKYTIMKAWKPKLSDMRFRLSSKLSEHQRNRDNENIRKEFNEILIESLQLYAAYEADIKE